MQSFYRLVLVVIVACGAPALVAGQAADTVFVGGTHSPVASGIIEFFVPTAGFAYAGDWTRGFLPNALRIGAYIGVVATADGSENDVCDSDSACNVWGVALLATTVWAIVGAVQTANDHNAAVRQGRAALLLEPSPVGGVAVGFRLAR